MTNQQRWLLFYKRDVDNLVLEGWHYDDALNCVFSIYRSMGVRLV